VTTVLERQALATRSPFHPGDEAAYRGWRDRKLSQRPRSAADLIVDVADPRALTAGELAALQDRCARFNMAVYRSAQQAADPALPRRLGQQLGLHRLDANWLADDDGISRIAVGGGSDGAEGGGLIPYTDRAIRWHTDGYYQPSARRIRAMILHCVQPAAAGGDNALIDHELAYIALRDASPRWVQSLMAPDAMTIPAREGAGGVVRPAQTGPVFSVDPVDGSLHMRYTARTRSIEWKDDPATRKAVAWLAQWMDGDAGLSLRLGPGMGIVANNVLHARSAFSDDPAAPRLLYRARYLDRVDAAAGLAGEATWRDG